MSKSVLKEIVMEIKKIIDEFREERDWNQFHNPKDLAISIAVESSELLECFQWKSNEEALDGKFQAIKEELADVLIYSYMLASTIGCDVEELIIEKLKVNNEKYPVNLVKSKKLKYDEYE